MRITLVAVGRLKERYWREAADEYLKRLGSYANVRTVEVPDRDVARDEAEALRREGADVLGALPEGAYVVALDCAGESLSSEELAERIAGHGLAGRSHLAFVIGGTSGLDGAVLARAQERLSLGRITLPHQLARVVLLEQLYRAFRIIRNEPYHR